MTQDALPLEPPRDRLESLFRHAADLALEIIWTHHLPPLRRGEYRHHEQRIYLAHGLTRVQTIATLAHELAHALHCDLASTPASERRAWETAGALTISVGDYAQAERDVGHHTGALAAELEVTPVVVDGWRRWYTRTSGSRRSLRMAQLKNESVGDDD